MRSGAIRLFRFAGIEVYLHFSWFLVAAIYISGYIRRYESPIWGVLEYLSIFVIRLYGLIHRGCAVDIFLVPQSMHKHHGNFERFLRQKFVDGLILPELVVAGMLGQLFPKTSLFESMPSCRFPR